LLTGSEEYLHKRICVKGTKFVVPQIRQNHQAIGPLGIICRGRNLRVDSSLQAPTSLLAQHRYFID
jgi:hypothetical protein